MAVEAPGCKSNFVGDTWNGKSSDSSGPRIIDQLPDIVPVFFTVIFTGSENSRSCIIKHKTTIREWIRSDAFCQCLLFTNSNEK